MSEWTARVKKHRVWDLMRTLGPHIDKALQARDIELEHTEALERLRSVLAFCGKRLGASDPVTVLPGLLDALAGAFESQKAEVEAFVTDHNPAHLANANNSADTALGYLAQIPDVSSSEELIALVQGVTSYRSLLEEQERSSSTARKEAVAEIAELTATLAAFKSQTESTMSELKSQLEAERQKIAA